MSDMEQVACNLCRSQETVVAFRESCQGQVFTIVRCRICGLMYVNPRPAGGSRAGAFTVESPEAEDRLALSKRTCYYRRWLKKLTSRKRRGRLLDIGCGTGVFLELVKEKGAFQGEGIEAAPRFADFCRKKGIKVHEGEFESVPLPTDSFEVVTMWDILEHLDDPRGVLLKVSRLLKRGGVLFVKVPNIRSLNRTAAGLLLGVKGKVIFVRDHPLRHLFYFSPATLSKMVSAAGLEVMEVRTEESAFSTFSANRLRRAIKTLLQGVLRLLPFRLKDEVVLLARKP